MSTHNHAASNHSIQRRAVWSGWMRLAHAAIALPVIVLIATAWLLEYTTGVSEAALDYHYIAGAFLAMGLILRAILLFSDRGAGRLQYLIPTRSHIRAYKKMLRFYFSFARTPLPRWYAHNPVWLPAYILMFIALTLLVLTGYSMESHPVIIGFYLPKMHEFWAMIITVLVIFHIIAAILHDLKGTGSDISAMINGYRIFTIEQPEHPLIKPSTAISIDEILKPVKKDDKQ